MSAAGASPAHVARCCLCLAPMTGLAWLLSPAAGDCMTGGAGMAPWLWLSVQLLEGAHMLL